jgi:hypothetical protein
VHYFCVFLLTALLTVRRFVASVLVIAYRTMATDALAAALNLTAGGAEFNAWVAAENAAVSGNGNSANVWAVDAGTVRLPSVEENQVQYARRAVSGKQ